MKVKGARERGEKVSKGETQGKGTGRTGMKTGNKTVLVKTRARLIQAGGASPQS